MPTDEQVPQPPQPPKIQQHVNLSRGQLIGLPVLLLIPILALLGVFGLTEEQATRSGEEFELTVHYSGRAQYMAGFDLVIEVTNLSNQPREGVMVGLSRTFVDSFTEASFLPSVGLVTGSEYLFDLGTMPAAASRTVSARLTPGSYWSTPGTVTVSSSGRQTVEFEFQTFVYP